MDKNFHIFSNGLFLKRLFDVCISCIALFFLWPVVLVAIFVSTIDTGQLGIFVQIRIGRDARKFKIYKIRTMKTNGGSTVTAANDVRITRIGSVFRRLKIDELPQLYNVLRGDMSFVGPRPDVSGYLDKLGPEWRGVISLRPGITGPATLFFRNEEQLLSKVEDAQSFNDTHIWPKKLELNRRYALKRSFFVDIHCILATIGLPYSKKYIAEKFFRP